MPNPKVVSGVVLCCAAAAVLYACSDDGVAGPGDGTVETTVGPAGGTVTGDGVTLTVPAGALSEDVTITLEAATPADLPLSQAERDKLIPGTIVDLGPDGLVFDEPVAVALSYAESSLPDSVDEALLEVAMITDGVARLPSTANTAANEVVGTTTHFTYFAVSYDPAPVGAEEAITVADSVAIVLGPPPASEELAETISISDSVAIELGPIPVGESVAEGIVVSDSVAIEVGPSPATSDVAESILVADSVAIELGPLPAATSVAEGITVTDSVAVELGPPPADETRVYIAVESDNKVVAFDPATNTVVDSVTVPQWPYAIGVAPDGSEVYTASRGEASATVIDASTFTVATTIPSVVHDPFDIAVAPDGSAFYVMDNDGGAVAIIDVTVDTVTGKLLDGPGLADALALNPAGDTTYVVADDTIVVHDLATETAVDTLAGTFQGADAAVTPDGTELVFTDFGNDRLVIVDRTALVVTATVPGISNPRGMDLTGDGATAWVAARGTSELVPVDLTSRTAGTPLSLPFAPYWVTVTEDGSTAYVTEGRGGTRLAVVDLVTGSYTTVTLGDGPAQIGITP